MAYISSSNIALIRSAPENFLPIYEQIATAIRNNLGQPFNGLSDDFFIAAFACTTAFDMATYGSGSQAGLKALLGAPYLNCATYCQLAQLLFRQARPLSPLTIYQVGWNGGAVGNHAQLFVTDGINWILLDPTVNYVVRTSFNSLMKGVAIPASSIVQLSTSAANPDPIASFYGQVRNALQNGSYLPSDLLYWFNTNRFSASGLASEAQWPTPAADALFPA